MTPTRAINEAAWAAATSPSPRLLPGQFIMRLRADIRAGLAELTSDQARNVAPWVVRMLVES